MKIGNIVRRANALSLALVLSTSTVLSMLVPGIAHATGAPYNCTWTGGGDGTSFSDAANWGTSCNNAAPQAGDADNFVFDNTNLSADIAINNDISSLTVGTISFQGTTLHSFTINGNPIIINGGITASQSLSVMTLGTNISLGADQTINVSKTVYFGGSVNLGSHNLTLSGAGALRFDGAISGSGDITDNNTNVIDGLVSDGDNSAFTGNLTINSGLVSVAGAHGLGSGAGATTVASGTALAINLQGGNDTTNEALNLNGTGGSTGFPTLSTYGASGDSLTLSGQVTLGSDIVYGGSQNTNVTGTYISNGHKITVEAGSEGLITTPEGTVTAPVQTITVDSNDSQPSTSVSVGFNQTYVIDGTRGQTYVSKAGTLKGTGTVGDLFVLTGGTVAPGHSPGCMNSGNLSLSGTYQAEIGGTTACTGYDQLNVTGTVTLSDGLTPATLPTLTTTLYNGFKPAAGDKYTIINNDGSDAVVGTFDGLAEGATFNLSGYVFSISYVGGDGNDVVLTVKSVPATPDTGFAFIGANPIATLLGTTVAAAAILAIAQRNRKAAVTVRARR